MPLERTFENAVVLTNGKVAGINLFHAWSRKCMVLKALIEINKMNTGDSKLETENTWS